jgi:hypothetical protein
VAISIFVIYLYEIWLENQATHPKVDKNNLIIKKYIKTLKQTKYIDILQKLEKLAISNNISLEKIVKYDDKFTISFSSLYKNGINFLYQSEIVLNTLQIVSVEFQTNKELLNIEVKYQYAKKINLYENKTRLKQLKIDPFFKSKNYKAKIILNAIVGDVAYINNKIVKKDDMVFDYRVTKILNDSVTLEKKDDIFVLRIYNDQYNK